MKEADWKEGGTRLRGVDYIDRLPIKAANRLRVRYGSVRLSPSTPLSLVPPSPSQSTPLSLVPPSQSTPLSLVPPSTSQSTPLSLVPPSTSQSTPLSLVPPSPSQSTPLTLVPPFTSQSTPLSVVPPFTSQSTPLSLVPPSPSQSTPLSLDGDLEEDVDAADTSIQTLTTADPSYQSHGVESTERGGFTSRVRSVVVMVKQRELHGRLEEPPQTRERRRRGDATAAAAVGVSPVAVEAAGSPADGAHMEGAGTQSTWRGPALRPHGGGGHSVHMEGAGTPTTDD
ncbi:unnamed protein product [Gadus morhua 'NCC']